MKIPPVPQMRCKKGGNDPQRFHPVELIGTQHLRVDHHRTQRCDCPAAVFPLKGSNQLIGSGIPIAVGQQLDPFVAGAAYHPIHLGVGMHG